MREKQSWRCRKGGEEEEEEEKRSTESSSWHDTDEWRWAQKKSSHSLAEANQLWDRPKVNRMPSNESKIQLRPLRCFNIPLSPPMEAKKESSALDVEKVFNSNLCCFDFEAEEKVQSEPRRRCECRQQQKSEIISRVHASEKTFRRDRRASKRHREASSRELWLHNPEKMKSQWEQWGKATRREWNAQNEFRPHA